MVSIDQLQQDLKLLFEKGKSQIALEKAIRFMDSTGLNEFDDIKDEFIIMLNQYQTLDKKIMKGLIGFEDAEIKENRLSRATLKLIGDLGLLRSINTEKMSIPVKTMGIVGTWKCIETQIPIESSELKLIWIIQPDYEQKMVIETLEGSINKKTPKCRYKFESNLFEIYNSNGKSSKELVEWIDDDNFISTILEGESGEIEGKHRVFTKIG